MKDLVTMPAPPFCKLFRCKLFTTPLLAILTVTLGFTFIAINTHAEAEDRIHLNQIGYLPNAPKLAAIESSKGKDFHIIDSKTGKSVFQARLGSLKPWEMSGTEISIANFSNVTQPGKYHLKVSKTGVSYPFTIGEDVYADVLVASIRAYYYDRAGAALLPIYAGQFNRPASHPDNIVLIHPSAASKERPAGTVIASSKGWFDAGDYNKYIVNSSISTYTLLSALDDYSVLFNKLELNIPESKNNLPDLLDEILWNLDWMLTMQDPNDGGVYHKLTTKRFAAKQMPHTAYKPRFVVQKSTAATLNFAATLAFASRVIQHYDSELPELSTKYLKAALKAWDWAQTNPGVTFRQPEGLSTKTYVEANDNYRDELFWASSELFLSTGKKRYLKSLEIPKQVAAPEWDKVAALGIFSLLGSEKTPQQLRQMVTESLTSSADKWVKEHEASPYKVAMTKTDFRRGSNGIAMNKAYALIKANNTKPTKAYVDTVHGLLDYIFGRNPLGNSYVTGFGEKSTKHIHHKQSAADGIDIPIPGFLAGGPHMGQQDADACRNTEVTYTGQYPATSYLDAYCSFATNEVAINWNAPLVYVLAALQKR